MELIPNLKRDSLLYESYCDRRVRTEVSKLIVILQEKFAPQIDIMMSKGNIRMILIKYVMK